jgi:large subunit ribosomal protein L29
MAVDLGLFKANELREKTVDELGVLLREANDEYADLRFRSATGQVENTSRIRHLRRAIARVQTLITEKQTATVNE